MFAQLHPLFQIWSLLAPKNKMVTAKMQTCAFKTVLHKPMGDVSTATSIIYTVHVVPKVLELSQLSSESVKEAAVSSVWKETICFCVGSEPLYYGMFFPLETGLLEQVHWGPSWQTNEESLCFVMCHSRWRLSCQGNPKGGGVSWSEAEVHHGNSRGKSNAICVLHNCGGSLKNISLITL